MSTLSHIETKDLIMMSSGRTVAVTGLTNLRRRSRHHFYTGTAHSVVAYSHFSMGTCAADKNRLWHGLP